MPTKKPTTPKTATAKTVARKPAAAKSAAPKSIAAKPASPRAAPKSAPRKPAAPKVTAKATTPAKAKRSLPSRALGAFSVGAAVVAVGAAITETVRRLRNRGEGHAAPDLALDQEWEAGDRAPDAFRPDPTAAVPAREREALRPATLELGSGRELDSVH